MMPGLELLLAIDISVSVDSHEFDLQKVGIVQAFQDPQIQQAIIDQGGIAVAVMLWSGTYDDRPLVVPWAVLSDYAAIEGFITAVAEVERPPDSQFGVTAIGAAIETALAHLGTNGIEAPRMVIDLASDGFNNDGPAPAEARRMAEAAMVTVNGLAVVEHEPGLPGYFRQNVVTSDGFVVEARGYDDFVDAMGHKLWLEIAGLMPGEWRNG